MKNSIVVIALASVLLASCSGTKETASGFKFNLVRKGDGVKIDSGKFLVMNFLFKDGKDSVWNDTQKSGLPAVIQAQGQTPEGDVVLEAVRMMTKGDSITFKVPAKTLFEKTFRQPIPPSVDSASVFTFCIGLKDVLDKEGMEKLQADMIAKQNEKMVKESAAQLAKDTVAIDDHLKAKNITALKTESGLRYVILQAGKGENLKQGQKAKINYAGYLLNGKYFDTNIEAKARENNIYSEQGRYSPLEVMVGYRQVIQGWEEMLQLMNKGSKVQVWIPSTLAYGNQRRSEEIVENSILVFDMELIAVEEVKE
jgi:FKBP-type peptidyl-prolyl cis-trans isomerase FkpA